MKLPTLRCSSISSHSTRRPSPMICQFLRCSGIASSNRHDHHNGMLTTRPSDRYAVMCLSVTSSFSKPGSPYMLGCGGLLSLATVLMPCLHDFAMTLSYGISLMRGDITDLTHPASKVPQWISAGPCSVRSIAYALLLPFFPRMAYSIGRKLLPLPTTASCPRS